MKLVMTTNLGLLDAMRFDIGPVREADILDIDGPPAEELLRRGWAILHVAPEPEPAPAKAGNGNGEKGKAGKTHD